MFINRKQYDDKFKTIGVKHFIKACILNDLFPANSLNAFLESTRKSHAVQMQNDTTYSDDDDFDDTDSDDDDSDDESMDDSDEEDEILTGFEANRAINAYNNVLDRNNNNLNASTQNRNSQANVEPKKQSVQDVVTNLSELNVFPISLQNIIRIRIKEMMPIYSVNSVKELGMLPRDIQRFILFQDEIDSIKRLT